MKAMNHKIELIGLIFAGIFTQFFSDLLEKTIIATASLVVATTVAHFWKKYLENKDKNL